MRARISTFGSNDAILLTFSPSCSEVKKVKKSTDNVDNLHLNMCVLLNTNNRVCLYFQHTQSVIKLHQIFNEADMLLMRLREMHSRHHL